MLSDFLFALNAVLPVFLVVILGYLLKNKGFLSDGFVSSADKLVFRVMLPCLLFNKTAFIQAEKIGQKELRLLLFCVCFIVAVVVLLCVFVPIFVKNKGKTGAFIQGSFRSNMAFLGVPFAISLFGEEGGTIAAIVLAITVPVYNVLAVTVLSVFDPDKNSKNIPFAKRMLSILKGIVTNPLIIAIALALPFGLLGAGEYIPDAIKRTIDYFANASTTLALIVIGASFSFSKLKGRVGLAAIVTALRLVVIPVIAIFTAHNFFGFSGVHLGVVMILFGTPCAVSSYIMAKNMNSDAHLANQALLMTTFFSMFTIFAFSFLMRTFGLI